MGPSSIKVLYESSHAAVATWQQVVIMAVRDQFSAPCWLATVSALDARAAEGPGCLLSLFGERAQLPASAVILEGMEAVYAGRAVCRARVVAGADMHAYAMRRALQKAEQACADGRPQADFDQIPAAADWLAKNMGKDIPWRLSLAAVAGTLLYGTPSYSRHSQVAPYLAGSPSEQPGGLGASKNKKP